MTSADSIKSVYEAIRKACLAEGKLWEDPDFPVGAKILAEETPAGVEWKRPPELCKPKGLKPELFVKGIDRFDVQQGGLGDCWALAAAASLASTPKLFERVIPPGQGFREGEYGGVFRFRFWRYGKWEEVLVDDRLPSNDGDLLYVHSSTPNEFWMPLLEKAYAKFYGSYQAISGGWVSEALTDFTGCLGEVLDLETVTPKELSKILLPASERNTIIGACIFTEDENLEAKKGLIGGHAYSVTGFKKVKSGGMETNLIRVRNPWGEDTEWKGRWSDKSAEWQKLSPTESSKLGLKSEGDGEFWMQLSDFKRNFQAMEFCYMTADSFEESQKCWSVSTFFSKWTKGVTAGGPAESPSFAQNPQFQLILTDHDDEDDEASFVVELTQMNRRRLGLEDISIGFYIYQVPTAAQIPLSKALLANAKPKEFYEHVQCRAAVGRYALEPGTYVIIPTAADEGEEADFMLRVFSETEHSSSDAKCCKNGKQ